MGAGAAQPPPTRPPGLLATAGVAVAVVLAGLCDLTARLHFDWPGVFWPAGGVAAAALAACGWRVWPGVVLGAGLLAALSPHPPGAAGVVAEGFLFAAVLRRAAPDGVRLDRLRDVGVLLAGAAAAAALPALATAAAGPNPDPSLAPAVVTGWLAESLGVVLLVPAALAVAGFPRDAVTFRGAAEAGLLALLLAVMSVAGLSAVGNLNLRPASVFATGFPVAAWLIVRFGPRGAAAANLIGAGVVLGAVAAGPIAHPPDDRSPNTLLFLLVVSGIGLCLGALTAERGAAVAAYRRERALYEEAERLAGIGSWEVGLGTGAVTWSPESYRQYGRDPAAEGPLTVDRVLGWVHPDDEASVRAAYARVAGGGVAGEVAAEFRVVRPDGAVRALRAHGRVHPGPGGRPARVTGFSRDVTAEKGTEAELANRERLFRAATEAAELLLRADTLADAMPEVLAALGRAAGTSRAYLMECRADGGEVYARGLFEWAAAGVSPQIDNPAVRNVPVRAAGYGRWLDELGAGRLVAGVVADLPPAERPLLEAQDVRSILVAPITVDGATWGVIGFDECAADRVWTAVERELLYTAAATIGAAIRRHRAEDRLREREEFFRGLLAHAHDITAVLEPDGRVRYLTDAFQRITGIPPEDVVGRSALDLVHPDDRDRVAARLARRVASPIPADPVEAVEYRNRTAAGGWVWLEAVGTNLLDVPGVAAVVVNARDITPRVAAEHAAERAAARYRHLFENAPIAIWEEDFTRLAEWFAGLRAGGVTDLRAYLEDRPDELRAAAGMVRVLDVNRAAVEMNAAPDKADLMAGLGRLFTPASWDAFREELAQLWDGHRQVRLEADSVRLDGRPLAVAVQLSVSEADGRPDFSRVVVTGQDITARRQLEEQVRQSQKMEAVGRLAGGVAHDFNNLLTVINGFAELLVQGAEEGSAARELGAQILGAGTRAAGVTRQLLAFARRQPANPENLQLNVVIAALEPLLRRLIREDVRLATRPAERLPAVRADRVQLEQVVINLVVNARDAMPAGGTVTVTTSVAQVPVGAGRNGRYPPSLPPGRYVMVAVADTGAGIPEAVRPHVFEPFFTTKEGGHGTGLGLATVYGIVSAAGGQVWFETAPGTGTTFFVALPAAPSGVLAVGPPPPAPPPAPRPARVLVAEDEDAVRRLTVEVLARAGFDVTAAPDGPSALGKAAAADPPFDILVTDVVMPGMNGKELADRLRAAQPDLRVVFVSGYTQDVLLTLAGGPPPAVLAKPFTPDALVRAVREMVTRPPGG